MFSGILDSQNKKFFKNVRQNKTPKKIIGSRLTSRKNAGRPKSRRLSPIKLPRLPAEALAKAGRLLLSMIKIISQKY